MSSSDTLGQLPIAVTAAKNTGERISALQQWHRARRSMALLAGLALALVIVADLLFYRQPIGWTLGLFAFIVIACITLRSEAYLRSKAGRLITVGLVLLCLALVEHPGPLRAVLALLAIATLTILNRHEFSVDVPAWLCRWGELLVRFWMQLPLDVHRARTWNKHRGDGHSRAAVALLNWMVPIILSLVFVALFATANPIISKWLWQAGDTFGRAFTNFGEVVSPARIVLWLMVGLPAWAVLRPKLLWGSDRAASLLQPIEKSWLMPRGLLVRCLLVFNFVFAVQLSLDLATVLSQGRTLPEGMTYPEYARRGAYPLVATALLAAVFVLLAFPSGERSGASAWSRRLVYLWIGQNILLTASAIWRLGMYIDAFGLTRLRVAAAIWMMLVVAGLISIIWRIVGERSNAWLLRVNTLTLLTVLFGCCFVNFDRLIAWQGVRNCYELRGDGSPRLDLEYLGRLGIDAIPALEWFAAELGNEHPKAVEAIQLAASRREQMERNMSCWQGWTLRQQRLVAGSGVR